MGHIQVHEGTEMYASHQLPVLRAPMSGTEQPPWHGLCMFLKKKCITIICTIKQAVDNKSLAYGDQVFLAVKTLDMD